LRSILHQGYDAKSRKHSGNIHVESVTLNVCIYVISIYLYETSICEVPTASSWLFKLLSTGTFIFETTIVT
jgi:hypothetical protein